jgi:hypothetical protein
VVREGRNCLKRQSLPDHRAGFQVQAKDLPLVDASFLGILVGVEVIEIETLLRLPGFSVVGACRQINPLAPDDGRRPGEPGNIRFPTNVLGRGPFAGWEPLRGNVRRADLEKTADFRFLPLTRGGDESDKQADESRLAEHQQLP